MTGLFGIPISFYHVRNARSDVVVLWVPISRTEQFNARQKSRISQVEDGKGPARFGKACKIEKWA